MLLFAAEFQNVNQFPDGCLILQSFHEQRVPGSLRYRGTKKLFPQHQPVVVAMQNLFCETDPQLQLMFRIRHRIYRGSSEMDVDMEVTGQFLYSFSGRDSKEF